MNAVSRQNDGMFRAQKKFSGIFDGLPIEEFRRGAVLGKTTNVGRGIGFHHVRWKA
jgi:hypothetical protein